MLVNSLCTRVLDYLMLCMLILPYYSSYTVFQYIVLRMCPMCLTHSHLVGECSFDNCFLNFHWNIYDSCFSREVFEGIVAQR